MKFLRIEKSLTSVENVVLTIVNRREGATLLNCDECHSIEVRVSDLMTPPEVPSGYICVEEGDVVEEPSGEALDLDPPTMNYGTVDGL